MKSKAKKIGLGLLAAAMMLCITVNPHSLKAAEKENGVQEQAYDTTKPVFEKLEFPQNGQTVKVGDKLPVYVYAYDADSGIKSISLSIDYEDKDLNIYTSRFVTFTYDEQKKCYVGEAEAIDGGYTVLEIRSVYITDNSGNALDKSLYDEGEYSYKANIEGGNYVEAILGEATSVEISKMHQTVSDKEELTFSVLVPDSVVKDIANIGLQMDNDAGGTYINLYRSENNSNLFTGTGRLSSNGKYVLGNMRAYDGQYRELGTLTYKNQDDIWVEVEKEDNESPVLKSIEMTHKGEFVKPGDKIKIRVKAEDNEQLSEYASVRFKAVADNIENGYIWVSLNYDPEENVYEGELEITDETYPCEWYIAGLELRDTSDNYVDVSKLDLDKDYYVMVKNGNTFVNPTYTVNASFTSLDDKGNSKQVKEIKDLKVERRTTWREVLKELPDGSTSYKGLKFQKWVSYDGKNLNLDDEILSDCYSSFNARYDKKIVKIHYKYPNKDLMDSTDDYYGIEEEISLDNDATYQDVIDHINNKKFDDLYDQAEFIGWQSDIMERDESTPLSWINEFKCYAQFKDKIVVKVERYFYDEKGLDFRLNPLNKTKYELVNKGTTYGELWKKYQNEKVTHYEGLRFKKWSNSWSESGLDQIIEQPSYGYASFDIVAEYENCLVNFVIKDSDDFYESENIYFEPVVVEKDTTITVPQSVAGYNIKWFSMRRIAFEDGTVNYIPSGDGFGWGGGGPVKVDIKVIDINSGDQLKISSHVNFYGYQNGTANPDQSIEKPIQPNKPEVNNKMSQQAIEETINQINNAKDGETLEVSMGNATIVPKSILEALKGKNVTVNLNMNGYTWSINGKEIMSNNLQDINLAVTMNTNNIPNKIIDQLAQGDPVKQLSLAHNGDFGFKANLSFNIGEEFKDKYGNLYYYDSDGKMVYMNAGQIKDDGLVSLSFSHASEYAVVISDVLTPNTGDSTNTSSYIYLLIGTMGIGYVLWKKRKETFNLKAK